MATLSLSQWAQIYAFVWKKDKFPNSSGIDWRNDFETSPGPTVGRIIRELNTHHGARIPENLDLFEIDPPPRAPNDPDKLEIAKGNRPRYRLMCKMTS